MGAEYRNKERERTEVLDRLTVHYRRWKAGDVSSYGRNVMDSLLRGIYLGIGQT